MGRGSCLISLFDYIFKGFNKYFEDIIIAQAGLLLGFLTAVIPFQEALFVVVKKVENDEKSDIFDKIQWPF